MQHHLWREIYIRWCCIDPLRPPRLPGPRCKLWTFSSRSPHENLRIRSPYVDSHRFSGLSSCAWSEVNGSITSNPVCEYRLLREPKWLLCGWEKCAGPVE